MRGEDVEDGSGEKREGRHGRQIRDGNGGCRVQRYTGGCVRGLDDLMGAGSGIIVMARSVAMLRATFTAVAGFGGAERHALDVDQHQREDEQKAESFFKQRHPLQPS